MSDFSNVNKFIYDWILKEWYRKNKPYCDKGKMKLWWQRKQVG